MRALGLIAAVAATAWASASPAAAAVAPPQIHTVASGIGQAAAVAAVPGGFLYVDSLTNNDLVRLVASGTTTTVAGNGTASDAADGTPAVYSGLNGPVAVAPTADGGFLVTEFDGGVVREVSPGPPGVATITTVAGTGTPGPATGTPGPATSIPLNYPQDAVPTADGSVVIADTGDNRVQLVSGGTMSTIAGGGSCDDSTTSCDGLPATQVKLDDPVSVSPIQGGAGGYLIAESDRSGANAIREVTPSGTFITVAGTPGAQGGYGGDSGPATAALLSTPQQVVSTSDGGFLIADTGNVRIRKVSASGTITTVAGNGFASSAGDGGAATDASFDSPTGVSPTSDGGMLISDAGAEVIRRVTFAPTTTISLSPDGDNGWYRSATAQVTVKTTQKAQISCELDPSQPPPVFDAIPSGCPYAGGGGSITGDGVHTVYAASVNSFGDKELPVSFTVKIDSTPPTLRCNGVPKFLLGDPNALLTATVSDSVSGPALPVASEYADTSSRGAKSGIVSGLNNAGIDSTVSCNYRVVAATLKPTPVAKWAFTPGHVTTSVKTLALTRVPVGSSVHLTCKGSGCPAAFTRRLTARHCRGRRCKPPSSATVALTSLFAGRRLGVGTSFKVSVTKPNTTGRVWVFVIQAGRNPSHRVSCLAPGGQIPGRGCQAR